MNPPGIKIKYNNSKQDAKRRGIEWLFTFESWVEWWLTDNRYANRGRGGTKFVMARHGDEGPYAPWNVRCATWVDNCAEIRSWRKSEGAAAMHARRKARGILPTLAVRGIAHPRSQPIRTPYGDFESGKLAAEHIGVSDTTIYERIKAQIPGWSKIKWEQKS